MNLFALTCLAVSVCCFGLAIFIFVIAKTKGHRIWALFNLTCFLWAIGTFFAAISKSPHHAELSWRWAYGLGAIVPCTFYYFIYNYCDLKQQNVLRSLYAIGLAFVPINLFSPTFIYELSYVFDSIYYNKATAHYTVFLSYLFFTVGLSFKELLNFYKSCTGYKKLQALYFLIGFGIGWSGGVATFLPAYNILIYPTWNIAVCVYTLLMTYAIFKHQLMDIRIIIKRGIIYSVSLATISILYLLCVFILERIAQMFLEYQSLSISVITAFSLGLLFIPIRHKIQYYMDRYFFKGTPDEIATQNEQLRQDIAQTEKYKTLSTLATGIAHEVKNPLTAIRTFTEYLPQKLDDKEFLKKFSRIVGQEVSRIDDMVHDLLEYGKPAPLSLKKTFIHKLITDTLEILSSQFLTQKISVVRRLAPGTQLLTIDPVQIKQALLNIFLNAIEAMPKGGTLTITTSVSRTSYFIIEVEDTGCGIPREDLSLIFDPYFSRKDHGTGLGLSITQSLIENHKGIIQIRSKVGLGTTVRIDLPC